MGVRWGGGVRGGQCVYVCTMWGVGGWLGVREGVCE